MHRGQFLPSDPSKGDETTVGGYAAVHGRPAALEGRNGMSYSIDILSDTVEPSLAGGRFGAYLVFVQWSRLGAQRADGHVESDFLVTAAAADEAERLLGEMTLDEAQRVLDGLLRARDGEAGRRWWSMTEADDEGGV